jgi:hypothetical protein
MCGALVAACCQSPVSEPPNWIYNPPLEAAYLYGIGSYVGALHPEDNQGYAMKVARTNLSHSLQSRVKNTTNMEETERASRIHSHTEESTDHVLQNSELVATWVDVQGTAGKRGTVWVLMRIAR